VHGGSVEKAKHLAEFLGRLNAGENPAKLKNEYSEVLALTNPTDLARAGQDLLESGMTAYDYCQLCEKITALLGDQVAHLRAGLSAGHPMQRIFFQHQRYLRILDEVENLNTAIANLHPAWAGCPEYKRLRNLAEDIDWLERHTMAEQSVLLPEIEQQGNAELARIIRFQHLDLAESFKKLKALIENLSNTDFNDLRKHFDSISKWLVLVGKMHITVEENIFYPIAGGLIKNKTTWDRFLAIFNQPVKPPAATV
jgi:DUF438 domain-containing protein